MPPTDVKATHRRNRFTSMWFAWAIALIGAFAYLQPKFDLSEPAYGSRVEQASGSALRVAFKDTEQKQVHASDGTPDVFVPSQYSIHFDRPELILSDFRHAQSTVSHRVSVAQPRAPPLI